MEYKEEEFLPISGLQHFSFCRRQWALIHIEQQWAENLRTVEGGIVHKHAHDAEFRESRKTCIITRGRKVHSAALGISGECDVLEFHLADRGIPLQGKEGLWQPYPIEYKRGKPGNHTVSDELQLCAQAICLEEMLCCDIPMGALYYAEIRHRQPVELTAELRSQVRELVKEMHSLYERGYTPKVRPSRSCNACSLQDLCLPELNKAKSVSEYLQAHLEATE